MMNTVLFFWQLHIYKGENWSISSFENNNNNNNNNKKHLTLAFSRTQLKQDLENFAL